MTGHRILADVEKIEAGVDHALAEVETRYAGRALTVMSSLAEGADRLIAHRVLARPGCRLMAVLPLEPRAYADDFATEASRCEFFGLLESASEVVRVEPKRTRQEAYEAAGLEILHRADVLIAIWDGGAGQGRGGTADIVRLARARALPLVWVCAGNRRAGTLEPTSRGLAQGEVTFENMPTVTGVDANGL